MLAPTVTDNADRRAVEDRPSPQGSVDAGPEDASEMPKEGGSAGPRCDAGTSSRRSSVRRMATGASAATGRESACALAAERRQDGNAERAEEKMVERAEEKAVDRAAAGEGGRWLEVALANTSLCKESPNEPRTAEWSEGTAPAASEPCGAGASMAQRDMHQLDVKGGGWWVAQATRTSHTDAMARGSVGTVSSGRRAQQSAEQATPCGAPPKYGKRIANGDLMVAEKMLTTHGPRN